MGEIQEFKVSSDCGTDINVQIEAANRDEENKRLLTMIRKITDRGNDAEVKKKGDGSLTVYEVKKNKVTV